MPESVFAGISMIAPHISFFSLGDEGFHQSFSVADISDKGFLFVFADEADIGDLIIHEQ